MKKYISYFRMWLVMGLQYRAAAFGGVVTQFWTDVIWDVDYLFVDTLPPTP